LGVFVRTSLILILILLALNISFGQDQARAVYLIEQGYTDLIENLADINADIRSTSDRQIAAELKFAKKELIDDFVEGPYRIFQSKSTIKNSGQKRYINHYLSSTSHHRIDQVAITISEVINDDAGLRVAFIQKGVQRFEQEIMAIFTYRDGELLISHLTDLSNIAAIHSTSVDSGSNKLGQIAIPAIEVDVTPESVDHITLRGTILNPIDQGTLSLERLGQEPYEIYLNEDHSFTTILSSDSNHSIDISLVYHYGTKFIQLHKNIVTVTDQPIFSVPAQVSVMDNPAETDDHE